MKVTKGFFLDEVSLDGKGLKDVLAVIQGSYSDSSEEGNSRSSTLPKSFVAPRELSRQMTKAAPKDGDLFSVIDELKISDKDKRILQRKGRKDEEAGRLLNAITDGINGGPLASKVIIALAQTLYQQSYYYETTGQLLGVTNYISQRIEDETGNRLEALVAPKKAKTGEIDPDTKREVMSPYSFILLKTRDFAKLVNGGRLAGGGDVEAVRDVIQLLNDKEVFIDFGRYRFFMTPLHIYARVEDEKTGAEYLLIEMKPIFTRAISYDFMTMRADTLKLLSGKQSDMTMKLFWLLIEQLSYKRAPLFPVFKIRKDRLFERIAIIKKYIDHRKFREQNFRDSVNKMKQIGLITKYEERTESYVYSVFHLNPNYVNEEITEEGKVGAERGENEEKKNGGKKVGK